MQGFKLDLPMLDYCVITGDIRNSRESPDRRALQQKIVATIAAANEQFESELLVKFAITLGDEWQGVLKSTASSYGIVSFFLEQLHPIAASFGVGEGAIVTDILPRSSEMDGEVFHRSRQAVEVAKQQKRDVVFVTLDKNSDLLLNATLNLLQILRESWTERQYEKVMLYKKFKKEQRVADELGVSQADINKTLTLTNGRVYLETQENLTTYLESRVSVNI